MRTAPTPGKQNVCEPPQRQKSHVTSRAREGLLLIGESECRASAYQENYWSAGYFFNPPNLLKASRAREEAVRSRV